MLNDPLIMSNSSPQIVEAVVRDACCLLELLPVSCWASLVGLLAAKDLLCLSLASKSVNTLISSTPGIWSQAACSALSARGSITSQITGGVLACQAHAGIALRPIPADHPMGEGSAGPYNVADRTSKHLLSALTAVAYASQQLKPQLKPQMYLPPPWLGVQPGRARKLVRMDGGALNPALQLTEPEVHWLSWGCLQGHDGGLFVSSCTSSPRTGRPCGCMAAVVINKQLVAELYLPSNCSALNQWEGVMTAPSPAAGVRQASIRDAAVGTSHVVGSAASSSALRVAMQRAGEKVADATAPAETQNAAQLCASATPPQMCVAGTTVQVELWLSAAVCLDPPSRVVATTGSGRATPHRRLINNRAGVTWHDVHALLMGSIADNAARVRAVRGTAIVPPGSTAAAELELKLAQLVAVGAPVLDVRQLQHSASCCYTQTALSAAVRRHQALHLPALQQQQEQKEKHQEHEQALNAATGVSDRACSSNAESLRAGHNSPLGSQHLSFAQQHWATALAAAQNALSAAIAQTRQQQQSNSSNSGQCSADDLIAEALAALVEQLAEVIPQVQLLVLPILLPTGRVGMRLPGGKLSAPRLLSLNVPLLVQLRCAWDKLPHLRQVLLMAGPPAQIQQLQQVTKADTGGGRDTIQQQQQQQDPAVGGLVRGVFSLQDVEQQWQQQQSLEVCGQKQVGQQQQRWERSVQDNAPLADEPAGHNRQRQQFCLGAAETLTTPSPLTAAASSLSQLTVQFDAVPASSIVLPEPVVLPDSALEAIQGMVWSCMDRLAPCNAGDV